MMFTSSKKIKFSIFLPKIYLLTVPFIIVINYLSQGGLFGYEHSLSLLSNFLIIWMLPILFLINPFLLIFGDFHYSYLLVSFPYGYIISILFWFLTGLLIDKVIFRIKNKRWTHQSNLYPNL